MTGMFKSPANSLGIELLSFDAKDVGHSNIQECDVVTIADQSNSLIIAKKLEAEASQYVLHFLRFRRQATNLIQRLIKLSRFV